MTIPTTLPGDESDAAPGNIVFGVSPAATGVPADTWSQERLISAGGLVFREAAGRIETLLCARNRPGFQGADAQLSWRLPKGTPEIGESAEQTARREVQEETGLQVTVLAPITSIRYYFVGHNDGVRYDKTVYFYLMEPSGGSTADHDSEFDVVEWREYNQALEILEYDNERSVLAEARSLIETYRRSGQP